MQEIQELVTEEQWAKAYPVLATLRTSLSQIQFLGRRELLLQNGYHLFGLFFQGQIVAVAGADIYPHVSQGLNCWVHDLATAEAFRSRGFGGKLMRHLEKWAKGRGCTRLCVHTRVERESAQRFYEKKLGYPRTAVVYYREL